MFTMQKQVSDNSNLHPRIVKLKANSAEYTWPAIHEEPNGIVGVLTSSVN